MFTGIITDVGRVTSIEKRENGLQLVIACAYPPDLTTLGASVACNGACMTVTLVERTEGGSRFAFDVSSASLDVTTIGEWYVGEQVNLEKSLRMGDELGGHMVSGHVDGVGVVEKVEMQGGNMTLGIRIPRTLAMFVAIKGSITVNGVSLTINEVDDNLVILNIIPHTLQNTNLSELTMDKNVNIEVDMLARYTARVLAYNKENVYDG